MLIILALYLFVFFVAACFAQVWVWDELTWKDRDRRAKRQPPEDRA